MDWSSQPEISAAIAASITALTMAFIRWVERPKVERSARRRERRKIERQHHIVVEDTGRFSTMPPPGQDDDLSE